MLLRATGLLLLRPFLQVRLVMHLLRWLLPERPVPVRLLRPERLLLGHILQQVKF